MAKRKTSINTAHRHFNCWIRTPCCLINPHWQSLTLQLEPDAAPALYPGQPQHLFITPAWSFVQELWNFVGWAENGLRRAEGDCAVAVADAWLMDYTGQHSPHLPLEKLAVAAVFAAFGLARTNAFSCWHDKGGQGGGYRKCSSQVWPLKEKTKACDLSPQLLEGWGDFSTAWAPQWFQAFC